MLSTKTSHILFSSLPAWGHFRALCVLALRLVREQENVVVTFMVGPTVFQKIRAEVSRLFLLSSDVAQILQRIRIISLPTLSSSPDPFEMMNLLTDAYSAAYQTLYEAKAITCSVTGTTFDAIPAPCAVVLDYFVRPQLHATRAISGHSVPIIACITAGAAFVLHDFGPESMGGVGDIVSRIDAEIARTGRHNNETFEPTEGKLVQVPGLPAMYDYEFFPQTLPSGFSSRTSSRGAYATFRECDATIINTSYAYESVFLDTMKQWFSDMQKELYVLGPPLPPGYSIETENGNEGESSDIETFLGEMLVQHGKNSVFYISFGTVFYPSASEYVDELIEALIEKKAPFVYAHASHFVKIPEQLIEKVKSSGLGKVTEWSPQQLILNHPATGWFVNHGGFNGVTESLGSGVPLICWPIAGDQPSTVVHLTENLNVAFELFQVRTGEKGLKPLARNGIAAEGTREAMGIEIRQTIDLCRSEKGQEKRNNAEKMKVKLAQTWEEDGKGRQEIRRFLRKYTVGIPESVL